MNERSIDGGIIRKLLSGERDQYREHLLRLDPSSRRDRFAGAVSDDFLVAYAANAWRLDTVIHGYFAAGVMRAAAELRPLGPDFPHEAELAFSVERPWQSLGIGSALLARSLLIARNRGYLRLHMACIAQNRRMQQLAAKFDAQMSFDFGSVVGQVAAPHPTPITVLRELVADSHGFATALVEVQARLFKTG